MEATGARISMSLAARGRRGGTSRTADRRGLRQRWRNVRLTAAADACGRPRLSSASRSRCCSSSPRTAFSAAPRALDPLERTEQPHIPELEPAYYGSHRRGHGHGVQHRLPRRPDRSAAARHHPAVQETYCRHHRRPSTCTSPTRRRSAGSRSGWSATLAKPQYDAGSRSCILERLTAAESLERYLHTRYVGQKRFSREGGETLIPLLDT